MKKLFKSGLIGFICLSIVCINAGLILSWYPFQSTLGHEGISPWDAHELREDFDRPHHQFLTSDGETLFLRRWNPDNKSTQKEDVAVLIFHGVTAHSGAYSMVGNALSEAGYTTFGVDYRGHGLSGGNRGDSPGKERWISDLTETVRFVKSLGFPDVIILGHSLGVAAALYTTIDIPDEIAGLMLLSGAYRARPGVRTPPSFFQKTRILASSLFRPTHQVIEYYREGMTGLDDPLFNFRYTLRFFRMLDMDDLTLPEDLNIPVLVGVGDRDELFEINAIREFYDDIPGQKKEFIVFEGAAHATFPEESWTELIVWLNKVRSRQRL